MTNDPRIIQRIPELWFEKGVTLWLCVLDGFPLYLAALAYQALAI
jgi:hypothetical protein